MAKRKGAYKSEKRKKELMRQKKQEMKRQKRIHKDEAPEGDTEATSGEEAEEGSGRAE
ncbi:MAG: hypothetical protein P8Z71_06170 [Candidatus Sulfobium sp.]